MGSLEFNTDYEVQVCRAVHNDDRVDNCGNCTLCFNTGSARGEYGSSFSGCDLLDNPCYIDNRRPDYSILTFF